MKTLARYALSISIAAALFAGCGEQLTPGGSIATPQSRVALTNADRSGSWVLPEAKSEALLYVANVADVTVYSYPRGRHVGTLGGFYRTGGECVDAAGDVFVTDLGNRRIVEYAHGATKPKAILQDTGEQVNDCAVDPTTGNLAVTSLGSASGTGDVAIYLNARGKPKMYVDPSLFGYWYCGYDSQGNLYVDGQSQKHQFAFAQLPKGNSSFSDITLDQQIVWPGGVQWDGKYIVVGDLTSPKAYLFSITNFQGTLQGAIRFGKTENPHQFWIDGKTILVTNETTHEHRLKEHSNVLFYGYPTGGKPVKAISRGVDFADGVTISRP